MALKYKKKNKKGLIGLDKLPSITEQPLTYVVLGIGATFFYIVSKEGLKRLQGNSANSPYTQKNKEQDREIYTPPSTLNAGYPPPASYTPPPSSGNNYNPSPSTSSSGYWTTQSKIATQKFLYYYAKDLGRSIPTGYSFDGIIGTRTHTLAKKLFPNTFKNSGGVNEKFVQSLAKLACGYATQMANFMNPPSKTQKKVANNFQKYLPKALQRFTDCA